MITYILMTLLSCFFMYLYQTTKAITIIKKGYALLSYFTLCLVAAFRYGIGTDYFYTYVPGYILLSRGVEYNYYEIGFYWLNRILINLSDNYQILFIVTSVLIYGLIFYMIVKYSESAAFSIFIFITSSMFFNSLNNIREFLAIAICFLGLKFFIDNHYKKSILRFYCNVIIACLFHTSAIIYAIIPLIFGKTKEKKHKKLFISGIGSKILLLICAYIIKIIIGIIGINLNFVNNLGDFGTYFDRYIKYFNSSSGSIYWSFLLLNLIIYFMMIYLQMSSNVLRIDRLANAYLKLQLLVCIIFIYSDIIPFTDRISRYFMVPLILSIPYYFNKVPRNKANQLIRLGCIFLFVIWICFYLFRGDDGILPYKSIFTINQMWQKSYFGF